MHLGTAAGYEFCGNTSRTHAEGWSTDADGDRNKQGLAHNRGPLFAPSQEATPPIDDLQAEIVQDIEGHIDYEDGLPP